MPERRKDLKIAEKRRGTAPPSGRMHDGLLRAASERGRSRSQGPLVQGCASHIVLKRTKQIPNQDASYKMGIPLQPMPKLFAFGFYVSGRVLADFPNDREALDHFYAMLSKSIYFFGVVGE